jgi:hypothetical protein
VSRLFAPRAAPPEARPALFSVISLIVLLVPLLLYTSSLERRTGLALAVSGTDDLPPEPVGPVEALRVERVAQGYALRAEVRNTDVRASAGDTERKEALLPDLAALQSTLLVYKRLDPARTRITLHPAADTTTEEVVRWMDAVRSGPEGELFPRVVLEAAPGPAPEAAPEAAPGPAPEAAP